MIANCELRISNLFDKFLTGPIKFKKETIAWNKKPETKIPSFQSIFQSDVNLRNRSIIEKNYEKPFQITGKKHQSCANHNLQGADD